MTPSSPMSEAFSTAVGELRDKENAVRQFRLHLATIAAGALALSASLWSGPPSSLALWSWMFHLLSVVAGVLGLHWRTTYDREAQMLETLNVIGAMPVEAKKRPKPISWHLAASHRLYAVQLLSLLLGLGLLAIARFLDP